MGHADCRRRGHRYRLYGIGLKAYDFLARRTRRLFLNAHAASQAAPRVAALMAIELGYNEQWESEQVKSFQRLSERYLPDELS